MGKRLSITFVVAVLVSVAVPPVASQAMVSPSPFEVRRDGNIYHAESQTTSSTYSGDLKDVVESATTELMSHGGGVIRFLAGDFDLGPDWFEFTEITDVTFEGQGMDVTIISNNASASTDTEPFDMTRSDRITVRDMTVHADGPPRNTSDALDFDGGDDVVIERVKVTGARGRGIIFDGKDSGQTATNNIIRDCIVTGVPADGIQLLASSNNLIENCTISNVGGMGIRVTKSSTSADQPNKKSNDNTISNNFIEFSGSHGIGVRASDRNIITGNTVLNAQNGNSGILISEANNIDCDDNIVQFNTATDNQPVPTQEFGLNIAHSGCHRTVVIDNIFTGNLLGDINDDGTDTIYTSADIEPPSPPTNLIATAVTGVTVDMTWNPSTDNIAVAAYDIHRDGALLDSVNGTTTTYQDITVTPLTSYEYVLRARDPAGNVSDPSNPLSMTTGAPPPIFTLNPTDDATIRQNRPDSNLGSDPTLEVDASSEKDTLLRFDVNAVGTSSVLNATLRLYVVDGSSNGGDWTSTANINWSENTVTWNTAPDADGTFLAGLGRVSPGTWVEIDVTALITGDGVVSIRGSSPNSNGADYVSKEGTAGFAPELVIELDEAPPSDTEDPSPPGNLVATDLQPASVSTQWNPSTDNVGVVAYDIYRDGGFLESVGGATTTYQDTSASPDSPYTYVVVARDAAGNVSDPSNTLNVMTPAPPDPGQAPVITLVGADPQIIEVGSSYVELGATAIDSNDGDLTAAVVVDASAVNTAVVGSYTVTYDVIDSSGNPAVQVTRTVDVVDTQVNDPPVAVDDVATVDEDSLANPIDVLSNDTDPEGDVLTIVSVTSPLNGTAVINNQGTPTDPSDDIIDYTPAADYSGPDSFAYTINDGTVGGDATATVSVTVDPTPPTTLTFTPTADAYVDAAKPDQNRGSFKKLRADASPDRRSYLGFTVSGVTGTVTQATLRVYATSASSVGHDVRVVADNSWDESTITYTNAPAFGAVEGSTGLFSARTWTEVDVTLLIAADGTYSFAITSTSTAITYASRESANPPELVLQIAP